MKPFVFSLERMRTYKEQVLTKEKGVLSKLRRRQDEIEAEIAALLRYREEAAHAFNRKQSTGVSAMDLSAHNFLMENTRRQLEQLRQDLLKAEEDVERQMKVVLAASQEVSSLDKLEEKKLDEYHYMQSKAEELEISELINVGLSREGRSQE